MRDMERFTEALQTTIRDMGDAFIKAIANLRQEEEEEESENGQ